MSKCDDLFQRKLGLDLEKNEINKDLARINKIRMSNQVPSEDAFRTMAERAQEFLNDQEAKDYVARAIKQKGKKIGLDDDVFVSSPQNKPSNFTQLLREKPEELARNWGMHSQAWLRAAREVMPENTSFLNQNVHDTVAMVRDAFRGGKSEKEIFDIINNGRLNPTEVKFTEDLLFARYIHDNSKHQYLHLLGEAGDFMAANPNKELPPELVARTWSTQKVAMMAEANYDFFRNEWSRAGKAQQGELFSDVLELIDEDLEMFPTMKNFSNAADYVDSLGIDKDITQVTADDPISKVFKSFSENITRPKEAYEQLLIELNDIRVMGADPRKRLDPKWIKDSMFKSTNLMVKDGQLFNERTGGLALSSNVAMAIYGPYKNIWKNTFYDSYGTKSTKEFWKNFLNNVNDTRNSYGMAFEQSRHGGKEVFMDAWNGDAQFYSNRVETYGKFDQTTTERLAEIKAALNHKPRPEDKKGLRGQALNPLKYRRTLNAAIRLKLFQWTKHPAALRPGLSMLSAIDAPFGHFYHSFKVHNDLLREARKNGVQLGLNSQQDIDKWVLDKFNEQFYSTNPTEKQILAYRKSKNIPEGVVTDEVLRDEIIETRVREKYGAPVPLDKTSKSASDFSEYMRFQAKPEPGLVRSLYDKANDFRREYPLADIAVLPYLNAPTVAAQLSAILSGAPSSLKLMGHYTSKTIGISAGEITDLDKLADVKANFIVSTHIWGMTLSAIATENIIGNGPVDPKDRAVWERDLRGRGKKPNSLFGIQFPGDPPIISEMFMLADAAEGAKTAHQSQYDGQEILNAFLGVVAGRLERQTALGTVSGLFEVFYGNEHSEKKLSDLALYISGSQVPFVGVPRAVERISQSKRRNLYREREFTKREMEIFDIDALEVAEKRLRDAAYGVSGLFGVFGGKYKDKDWLGTNIKLPFPMDVKQYLPNRFFPQLHANDKVYPELKMLGLLDPPQPLLTRTLNNVPMSDDLQKEYNDTYGALIPELSPKGLAVLGGPNKKISVNTGYILEYKKYGVKKQKNRTVYSFPINDLLEKHATGKTFIDAARSLMNDPMYKKWEASPTFTGNVRVKDKTPEELAQSPQALAMRSLKNFYHESTVAALRKSKTGAALKWQKREKQWEDATKGQKKAELENIQDLVPQQ